MNRVTKYSIAAVLLALTLISILLFAMRDNIVRFTLNPRVPYQTYTPPPAPDYTKDSAWAAKPGLFVSELDFPSGVERTPLDLPVNVFFAHTSNYYGSEHWNAPIDDREVMQSITDVVLPLWAGPFSEAGRIYAPRYRSATLYSFLSRNQDSTAARKTAYRDLANAFRAFQRMTTGEPFILVGHGQGGMHVVRLLQEFVIGKDSQEKLIAAYVMDYPVPKDLLDISLNTLSVCNDVEDINCIVSWNAFQYDSNPEDALRLAQIWNIFGNFENVGDRELICVNPLTWESNELPAPNPLNLGGIAHVNSGRLPIPTPEISGAQCRDGFLLVDDPENSRFRLSRWPTSDIRVVPYNLFYMNIRENVLRRTKAFFEKDSKVE